LAAPDFYKQKALHCFITEKVNGIRLGSNAYKKSIDRNIVDKVNLIHEHYETLDNLNKFQDSVKQTEFFFFALPNKKFVLLEKKSTYHITEVRFVVTKICERSMEEFVKWYEETYCL
jgi:hypothetical protein